VKGVLTTNVEIAMAGSDGKLGQQQQQRGTDNRHVGYSVSWHRKRNYAWNILKTQTR
jgi:hypothetical protein